MRRCTFALIVLALAGCRPDVHIHVYDDDGDDTDGAPDTDSGFSGSASNADTSASDSDASASDSTPTASATASASASASASDSASDGDPSTTSGPTSDSNGSSSDTSGGETSDGGAAYPQPTDGACPDGFGYNADGGFEFCGPECGGGNTCPDTTTGNVLTMCVFNPDSSMAACVAGMCENVEEDCFAGACMLPATHCAPLCSTADAVCPIGMECTNNNVCRFPI